jgi:HSP20 family molecular chaperone IbpA
MKTNNTLTTYNLNDIFDALFCDFESVFKAPRFESHEVYHAPNFPPVNIYISEESKDLTFDFALAGYKKEDISINFNGDKMVLTLKGLEAKRDGLKLLKKGLKVSDVESVFTVPASKYDTEYSVAKMEDGILTINIPAKDEIKSKRIIIT